MFLCVLVLIWFDSRMGSVSERLGKTKEDQVGLNGNSSIIPHHIHHFLPPMPCTYVCPMGGGVLLFFTLLFFWFFQFTHHINHIYNETTRYCGLIANMFMLRSIKETKGRSETYLGCWDLMRWRCLYLSFCRGGCLRERHRLLSVMSYIQGCTFDVYSVRVWMRVFCCFFVLSVYETNMVNHKVVQKKECAEQMWTHTHTHIVDIHRGRGGQGGTVDESIVSTQGRQRIPGILGRYRVLKSVAWKRLGFPQKDGRC